MISKQIAATLALGEEERDTVCQRMGFLPCPVLAHVLVHFSELNAQELLLYFEVEFLKTRDKKHFLCLLMLLKVGAHWKSLICIPSPLLLCT